MKSKQTKRNRMKLKEIKGNRRKSRNSQEIEGNRRKSTEIAGNRRKSKKSKDFKGKRISNRIFVLWGWPSLKKAWGWLPPGRTRRRRFFPGGPDLFRLVVVAFSRGLVTPGIFFRSLSFLSSQGVLGGADGDDGWIWVDLYRFDLGGSGWIWIGMGGSDPKHLVSPGDKGLMQKRRWSLGERGNHGRGSHGEQIILWFKSSWVVGL